MKKVKIFDGRYTLYEDGKIVNEFGKTLKSWLTEGYPRVVLWKRGAKKKTHKIIHRLVAEHFVKNPNNKPCVNHKDGDKTNNHYSNLEWCTYSENHLHAYKNGLMHSRATSKRVMVIKNGIEGKKYDSMLKASKDLKMSRKTISDCCKYGTTSNGRGFVRW